MISSVYFLWTKVVREDRWNQACIVMGRNEYYQIATTTFEVKEII